MRILQRQQKRQRDQRAHPFDLLQQRHLRITLLRQFSIRSLHSRMCSLNDSMPASNGSSAVAVPGSALRLFPDSCCAHCIRATARRSLGQSAGRVHQRRPRSHQSGSRPDHRQIRLRFRAAMLHRTQQLRIDPGQPRQRPRIQPIVFLSALPNQTHVAGMRHDHFVPQLAQQPGSPRANASPSPTRCDSAACPRTPPAWLSELSPASVPAAPRPASSSRQYQLDRSPRSNPIVSFCSEKFLRCFVATVLTFFIAGLLLSLRFERVDNLGAYSIPSETGLLIPSGYVNHPLPLRVVPRQTLAGAL